MPAKNFASTRFSGLSEVTSQNVCESSSRSTQLANINKGETITMAPFFIGFNVAFGSSM